MTETEDKETRASPTDHAAERSSVRKTREQWLIRSLKVLKHTDPSSLLPCLVTKGRNSKQTSEDGNISDEEADRCVYFLTLWLETHIIRQWDNPTRNAKFENFCANQTSNQDKQLFASSAALEKYLAELGCPTQYILSQNSVDDEIKRYKVIHWIVSCAISKSYQEFQRNQICGKNLTATQRNASFSTAFSLGFTTGFNTIDELGILLRMKYLLQLRSVQDEANRVIDQMQLLSISSMNTRKTPQATRQQGR